MYSQKLLVLGGYGNAGLAIARLLANVGKLQIILAGRSIQRALEAAQQLNAEFGTDRFSGLEVSHTDAYVVTAAPAVACLFQYFGGTIRKPGLWKQATLVEPVQFFDDLARLGLQVKLES